MEKLLGSKLYSKSKGGDISIAEGLGDAKYVMVYFSAHWCPPCRGFTPTLSKWCTDNAGKHGVKIVFVSSDQDEDAFKSYFSSMSWDLALPFGDPHKDVIGSDVRGIPTLKIFDAAGNLVCGNARSAVTSDPDGASFPYKG